MTTTTFESNTLVTKKVVEWRLNDCVQLFIQDDNVTKQSKTFEVFDSNGVTSNWTMSLNFSPPSTTKRSDCSTEYLVLVISLDSTSNNAASMDASMTLNLEGKHATNLYNGTLGPVSHFELGKTKFFPVEVLRRYADISNLLGGENTLVFHLDVTIFHFLCSKLKYDADPEVELVAAKTRCYYHSSSELENDKSDSDVVVISKDGLEYYAHRRVFIRASGVLQAMLPADLSWGQLKIDDLSGEAVKIMLHFIYTGEMAEEWQIPGTIEEVIHVADKYKIVYMKALIDLMIGKLCSTQNAAKLLLIAHRFDLKRGASDILKFIKEQAQTPKQWLEIMKNGFKDFKGSDKSAVTDTVTNASTAATSEKLPGATPAKRARK